MITEKEHQENLNGLIKQWKTKRTYYGELADTLIKHYHKHLTPAAWLFLIPCTMQGKTATR